MRTQQIGEAGVNLFIDGLKNLAGQLTAAPILNAETGSMNEATKGNAYYGSTDININGTNINKNDYYEIQDNPKVLNRGNSYTNNTISTYIDNLENLNRNNPNKILSQKFNSPEDITNVIKNFHKKTQ